MDATHEMLCRCEACEMNVTPVRPSRTWRLATPLVWLFIITAGPLIAIMPPLNLVTVPIFLFAASAMVGYVSDKNAQVPSCPRCGRDLPGDSKVMPQVNAVQRQLA